MTEYCFRCGQKISAGNFFTDLFGGDEKPIEMEEGTYCYKCGKAVVENRRSGKEKRVKE